MEKPATDKITKPAGATGSETIPQDTGLLIGELQQQIDRRLEELFPQKKSDSRLVSAMRYGLLSPGKRLRAILTLLACRQCGGDVNLALDTACAIEMVHAASLVIDDVPCMDNARLRRGGLATHVVFGDDVAILAAISLLNESYRIIAMNAHVDHEARTFAVSTLSNAVGVHGLAGGQERDISCNGAIPDHGMKDIERRHLEKTGALFSAAAVIGAATATRDREIIKAMECFGSYLGIAYQTFDDVADVVMEIDESGKDKGQDQDKTTVYSLLGEAGARQSGSRWIERAVSSVQDIDKGAGTPLCDLARLVEMKFGGAGIANENS